jgi:hypothetical protein
MLATKKPKHKWTFFRAGGFDQVSLSSGADLAHLDELDQKLWVALACPTTGLEFDPKTLALVDTDKDGRIRAPELIAAAKWLTGLLKNPDDALKRSPSLPLAAINDATPEGRQLLSSARQILENLGKPEAAEITLEDTADTARIFAQTKFNGDGIVPADAAASEAVRSVIGDIIACLGADTDRSGKPGVSQARVDEFFKQAQAYAGWRDAPKADGAILPLGEATFAAAAAVRAVRAKVDDYFTRCRLAAFDDRATAALNREEKDYQMFAAKDLTLFSAEIAALPLAHVRANKPLALAEGLNPAWTGAVAALRGQAIGPLLGERSELTESDWAALLAKLAAFDTWTSAKAGAAVEPLGIGRVREILEGPFKQEITALIAKDKALEPEANSISSVDRLIRYHRDLHLLCSNFVNFRHFYEHSEPAIFQAGTLYLDQRSCEFTLPVADAGRHAAMAGLAGAFLAYCDCVRRSTGETRQIVAAFTDGDSDNLMVGRNGVFYDRAGRDWDATITKMIESPISLREALWLPYRKFSKFIESQVAKRATASDAQATAKLDAAAATIATADTQTAPAPPRKMDVGTVAALGVAFGAIGTFLATLWGHLVGIIQFGTWGIVGAVVGLLLLISGPSVVLGYIRLRKRNLGPILDANGWAVNARAKINVPFGRSLTQVAALPPGAKRSLRDPYAQKRNPWVVLLIVAGCLWIVFRIFADLGGVGWVRSHIKAGSAGAKPVATSTPGAASTNAAPLEK